VVVTRQTTLARLVRLETAKIRPVVSDPALGVVGIFCLLPPVLVLLRG